jgi:hypothetical protein
MAKTGPNKSKEWRKQSKLLDPTTGNMHRVGRKFKAVSQQMSSGKTYPTEMIVLLMKHADIETPIFDANLKKMHQLSNASKVKEEIVEQNDVQDVELIS